MTVVYVLLDVCRDDVDNQPPWLLSHLYQGPESVSGVDPGPQHYSINLT